MTTARSASAGATLMTGYWHSPRRDAARAPRAAGCTPATSAASTTTATSTSSTGIKDLIIRGGINVYPRDIEDAMLTHPDVVAGGGRGRPDDVRRGGRRCSSSSDRAPTTPADLGQCARSTSRRRNTPGTCGRRRHPADAVLKTDRKALRKLLANAGS